MNRRWASYILGQDYPDPAPEFLFQRKRIGRPMEPSPVVPGQFAIRSLDSPTQVWRRTEHFDFSVAEMPALSVALNPMCSMSATGEARDRYSVDLHAEILADDEQQAQSILGRLALERRAGTLCLKTPPYLEHVRSHTYLDAMSPADRPVVITGAYAAVELCGIHAPVTVSTSHGRIQLLDNSGPIDATATEGGGIVFAGKSGRVHLNADLGIDIKITDRNYDGIIEAKAAGPIRVLLPRGFIGSLEANISSGARFVCRADLGSRVQRRKESTRIMLTHGEGQPRLRLVSLRGPVVIDQETTR